jgi:diguanylate cyclase (GGDEF)-like protein
LPERQTVNTVPTMANREEIILSAQILQRIPVPTFVIDLNHTVIHWNRAIEKLTQVAAPGMVGTGNHWQAFYRSERPLMADLVVERTGESLITDHYDGKSRKSAHVEDAYEAEVFFPDMGEGGKWMIVTAAPVQGPDGAVIGAVQTFQDITERRRAEEEARKNEQRYREMSITDSLTKLYNSRHFFRQLKQEVERTERYGQPLSLILLDIDNFKSYNDTYGHMEGDRVLATLAAVIRKNLRTSDTGFRYGGEEFTVLLPQTELESALAAAERLRESFAETTLSPLPGVDVRMTVSIGAGQYFPGEKEDAYVKRVDAAMYKAKQNGKNRVLPAA